jgi:hypothetical protein
MIQLPENSNPDTKYFRLALFEWNCKRTGSANTNDHKPAWRLSAEEWSQVARLAQTLKQTAESPARRNP